MLELVTSHLWCLVRNGPPEELEALSKALTVSNPGYYQAVQRGVYGAQRYVSFVTNDTLFATGLLPRALRAMRKEGIETRIVNTDLDPIPAHKPPTPDMFPDITLNDAQLAAIEALLNAPIPRGYLAAHPGFGKTEAIFALYECFRPCRALLIVTRAGLRKQAFKRCEKRLGEKPYVLGKSKGPLPDNGLIVTTYHTLHRRLFGYKSSKGNQKACPIIKKYMAKVQLLLADECHRAGSKLYSECLSIIEADRRYGFSATPMKSKNPVRNMTIRSWLGERLHRVNRKQQLSKQRISRVDVHTRVIGRGDPIALPHMLDYQTAFRVAYMTYNPFKKAVLRDALWFYQRRLPTLILVDWFDPGQLFYELLCLAVPPEHVAFLHGKQSETRRDRTKEEFFRGDKLVLIATPCFGEGEDLPNVRGLLMACAGKDPDVFYQRTGRGMRTKADGNNVLQMVLYLNQRHRYFRSHAKQTLAYLERNKDLYTVHHEGPLEVVHGPLVHRD